MKKKRLPIPRVDTLVRWVLQHVRDARANLLAARGAVAYTPAALARHDKMLAGLDRLLDDWQGGAR